MGHSGLTLRCLEQRLPTGCRLSMIEWDLEADQPRQMDERHQATSFSVVTLTFNGPDSLKPWRMSVAKAFANVAWPIPRLVLSNMLVKMLCRRNAECLERAIASTAWPSFVAEKNLR